MQLAQSQCSYNGTDGSVPVEVRIFKTGLREILTPTEYHEPVYANPFRPTTPQREKVTPGPKLSRKDKN